MSESRRHVDDYRYLTRSYVEALGLAGIPILKQRNTAHCSGIGGTLPEPGPNRIVEGVSLNGQLYERESDGLAYVRLDRDA